MSWTGDLLQGVAAYLDAHTSVTWRPNGSAYQASEVGVFLTRIPTTPDRVVALTTYNIDADGTGDVVVGLQVRTRGTHDPLTAIEIADEIREELDGLNAVRLGGVLIHQIFHRYGEDIGTDQGEDVNRRCERVDNFYVQASRITALQNA